MMDKKDILKWAEQRELLKPENAKAQTIKLMEEVGELARIMARKYGEQSFKGNENELNAADEMADILFVLICLANQTGVDLTKAFEKNLEKKNIRDSKRHLSNPKLFDSSM